MDSRSQTLHAPADKLNGCFESCLGAKASTRWRGCWSWPDSPRAASCFSSTWPRPPTFRLTFSLAFSKSSGATISSRLTVEPSAAIRLRARPTRSLSSRFSRPSKARRFSGDASSPPAEPPGCRLQKEWAPIAARLRAVMEETTLAQVASRSSAQRSEQRAGRAYA